jgi:Tfp pilus assembly protein PilZ
MKNERSIKRRHLFFYLQVTDLDSKKLLGYVVDITPKGLKIVSENDLAINKELNLKMNLPDEIGKTQQLQFRAKVVWCGADVNSDFYAIGLEMMDQDEQLIAIVEEMVNEYGFEDLE